MKRVRLLAIAAAAAIFTAGSATASTLQFEALMDSFQETPPIATPGTGFASLSLDDVTGDWTLSGTFTDLVGTTTIAHIHGPAPVGTAAGVVVGLTLDLGVSSGSVSGAGTFTAPQMADLQAGSYYVNIHSTLYPGGEIRGQLDLVPEPTTFVLLGLGAVGLLGFAWRRRR